MKWNSFFAKPQIKIFLVSLCFQFVISSFLLLGVRPPEFLSLLKVQLMPSKSNLVEPTLLEKDPFSDIEPLLEKKTNNFSLHEEKKLIPEAYAAEGFEDLSAFGVIDFNSGEVLFEKNLNISMPIASLTKVMTAVVALDLASADEVIIVNQQGTTPEPSKLFLRVGEQYSLSDLLHFMLITSANDSAEVIKEGINQKYGQDIFIRAMNKKAEVLGLKNTNFTNPQGFDNRNHFSSIADLAVLTNYALTNYPLIADIVSLPSADFREVPGDNRLYLNNWNGLLGVYPGVKGVKTGNTDRAKHTNIVVSDRDGQKILVVLFGAPTILDRDIYSAQLLDLGFSKFDLNPISVSEEQLKEKYASWKRF